MKNWRKVTRNKRNRRVALIASSVLVLLSASVYFIFRGARAPALHIPVASTLHLPVSASQALSLLSPPHAVVWLLGFDDRWRVLLGDSECPVSPGMSIGLAQGRSAGEAAASLAEDLLPGSSARVVRVGAPFAADGGPVTHVFAVALESAALADGTSPSTRFIKPVRVAQEARSGGQLAGQCNPEEMRWVKRAVAFAVRLFFESKRVPRLNPMEDAAIGDELCCDEKVNANGNLSGCAKPCTDPGVFNILSVFPNR